MTKLKGIRELAQAIFQGMPVRIGLPQELGGLFEELKDPAFATVTGLLLYRAGRHTQYEIDWTKTLLHHKELPEAGLKDIELGRHEAAERTIKEGEKKKDLSHYPLPDRTMEREESREKRAEEIFSFDDLPKLNENDSGSLNKLINWAKQLF
jgi:cell division protein FtsA